MSLEMRAWWSKNVTSAERNGEKGLSGTRGFVGLTHYTGVRHKKIYLIAIILSDIVIKI